MPGEDGHKRVVTMKLEPEEVPAAPAMDESKSFNVEQEEEVSPSFSLEAEKGRISGEYLPLQLSPKIREVTEPPPAIFGYMYKKSPDFWRFRGWDWRFFIISEMKVSWWTNHRVVMPRTRMNSFGMAATSANISTIMASDEADSTRRGGINFYLSSAIIEADISSPSVFTVRPRYGKWSEGSTTDKHQDEARVYVFDTQGSEHSRERWMMTFRSHIAEGQRLRDDDGGAVGHVCSSVAASEYWEDDSVCDEQAAAAARLVAKMQAKSRGHR